MLRTSTWFMTTTDMSKASEPGGDTRKPPTTVTFSPGAILPPSARREGSSSTTAWWPAGISNPDPASRKVSPLEPKSLGSRKRPRSSCSPASASDANTIPSSSRSSATEVMADSATNCSGTARAERYTVGASMSSLTEVFRGMVSTTTSTCRFASAGVVVASVLVATSSLPLLTYHTSRKAPAIARRPASAASTIGLR